MDSPRLQPLIGRVLPARMEHDGSITEPAPCPLILVDVHQPACSVPGWKELDEDARARIAPLAKSYVLEHGPNAEEWLGTSKVHLPAVAGYMALRLFLDEDAKLSWIPSDAWQRWAPAVVGRACRAFSEDEEEDAAHALMKLARRHAPLEVIKALKRLRGETPTAVLLWSDPDQKRLRRPKSEENVSALVADHLIQDLRDRKVVINREVSIRLSQRTDIHVVAPLAEWQRGEQIGLIIEVKGCWNPELDTAMEEQLVERYLADNPGRAGLYLVAWFPRQQWSRDDHRRSNSRLTLEEARSRFNEQARVLSRPERGVAALVIDASLR